MADSTMRLVGSGVFGVAGLILLLVGLFEVRDSLAWRERAKRATGVVERLEEDVVEIRYTGLRKQREDLHTDIMTVGFEVDGKKFQLKEGSELLSMFFEEGGRADVLYQEEDPSAGRVDFFLTFWGLTVGLFFLAFMFLGAACLVFKLMRPISFPMN